MIIKSDGFHVTELGANIISDKKIVERTNNQTNIPNYEHTRRIHQSNIPDHDHKTA